MKAHTARCPETVISIKFRSVESKYLDLRAVWCTQRSKFIVAACPCVDLNEMQSGEESADLLLSHPVQQGLKSNTCKVIQKCIG